MHVLLTGSDGFTGRYLSAELERRGHTVAPLQSDLTDPLAIESEIVQLNCDAAVHLAGIAFVDQQDFHPFYEVNQLGTLNLLTSLAKHRSGARVILAGTANIYGPTAGGEIDESTCPNPINHYAISKLAMEQGAKLFSQDLRITVLRLFNYTGVGQDSKYLVPKIVDHFKRRADFIELGNLEIARDFGDVRSVAEAYCGLLEVNDGEGVINVATGVATPLRRLVQIASELTGHQMDIRVNPDFVRSTDIPSLCGDITRLRSMLPSWQPKSIDQTLEWMLASSPLT